MIYLDEASTAKYKATDDIVVDAITKAMKDSWTNPSALYATNIKNTINECRANVAKFIGAEPNEIYFTSGATESNNWAIRGWDDEIWLNTYKKSNIITTPIEHKSIMAMLEDGNLGSTVYYCWVKESGLVDYTFLERMLSSRKYKNEPTLVSIGMANNEIGVIQDIKAISDLVHKYNGILHVDATQVLPYMPIDVNMLGIDMLSASGHKLSTVLKGVGFLYKRNGLNIQPLIYGNQEGSLRGGTENVFGIIGLNRAIEVSDITYGRFDEMCCKRDYFLNLLESKFDCRLNGHREHRLPNNINVTFNQDITSESLLYMLDMADIKISVGSACNSGSIKPSYVLKAIGLTDEEAARTVRFTLPNSITYEQIDYVVDEIDKTIKIMEMD